MSAWKGLSRFCLDFVSKYAQVRQTVGEPDPFRKMYRDQIRATVADIITQALDESWASERIQVGARQLPEPDRRHFVEVVETELISLHEGNFARYKVSPSQFANWQRVWKRVS